MTAGKRINLVPGQVSLDDIRAVLQGPVRITLDSGARGGIDKSHAVVQKVAAGEKAVYGINTGFGLLASRRIGKDQLDQLQTNLVLSHAAGTGALLPDDVVRLVLFLKVNGLARGHSGVSLELIEFLVELFNAGACPCIPEQGSVGASGDLAPLAHLSAAVIGTGRIRMKGRELSAAEALQSAGLSPFKLGAKEGLALLNGTQVSTALALRNGLRILDLCKVAIVTSAMSVDAIKGSDTPLDPRLHDLRGHAGQATVAAAMRALLAGSEIRRSHLQCDRVQDPYSIRCQPQVTGAALDFVQVAISRLVAEANAVTDNPLVFPETGEVLSGGNFHAEPVAMAADMLAIAAAEIGAIAERRIALLIDPHLSGLPPFLVRDSGLNSGFMLAQVTAAALASENKSLAHPASVDSLPTSANQEDHVSMATFAARRLATVADNVAGILAIELLAAGQGIDFHRPLKTSAPLQEVLAVLRERVQFYEQDRFFADDIAAARALIVSGTLQSAFDRHVSTWQ